jgi:hypothetical protein
VDVGVRLCQSRPALAVKGLLALGMLMGAIAGSWPTMVVAGFGALFAEGLLAGAGARLGRVMAHAIETSFRSLPLEVMPAGVNGPGED